MKTFFLGVILTGAAMAGFGCEAEVHPATVGVGVDYDTYYERGAYVGPEWVWHDRGGHEFREARDVHERRVREHGEHHEEHH